MACENVLREWDVKRQISNCLIYKGQGAGGKEQERAGSREQGARGSWEQEGKSAKSARSACKTYLSA